MADVDASVMVDLLLRSGADETIVDEDGKAAAEVVGQGFEEDDYHEEGEHENAERMWNVEHLHRLLENAPADRADRARRLRVYLVFVPRSSRQNAAASR